MDDYGVRQNPLSPILGPYNPMPRRMRRRGSESFDDEPETQEDEDLTEDEELLGLFKGHRMPDYKIAWEMYQKGLAFNTQINLEETVNVNENFFIGRVV